MDSSVYKVSDSEYMQKNESWHAEDSRWKAKQIFRILQDNRIFPGSVAEIGCGAGGVLVALEEMISSSGKSSQCVGYDISPDAINLAKKHNSTAVDFFNGDLLEEDREFHTLLMIDVFEHVEDYIGFIRSSSKCAEYTVFHIPLDIHLSAVLRSRFVHARRKVGHLHYFSAETALATLETSGLKVLDSRYTAGGVELQSDSLKRKLANLLRVIIYRFSPTLAARILGGYSLLVLTSKI